jgi:hypothetical protein
VRRRSWRMAAAAIAGESRKLAPRRDGSDRARIPTGAATQVVRMRDGWTWARTARGRRGCNCCERKRRGGELQYRAGTVCARAAGVRRLGFLPDP